HDLRPRRRRTRSSVPTINATPRASPGLYVPRCRISSAGRFGFDDADALAAELELHVPLDEREDREVATQADVPARMITAAALTADDAARTNRFAAVQLDAQSLRIRVAAVLRRALTFLMSHDRTTSGSLFVFLFQRLRSRGFGSLPFRRFRIRS